MMASTLDTARSIPSRATRRWLALLGLLLLVLSSSLASAQSAGRNVVSSENALAAREALAQMQAGGNAVDAAVTAVLVAGVASPTSSGIGGGGFALVWDASTKSASVLDFREVAPRGVDVAAFERRPLAWNERGKYVGVPGEVAGLYMLHKKYGKRTWKQVVEPAIRAAKKGFPVESHLAKMLAQSAKTLIQDPGIAAVYYPNGKPAAQGNLLKNPKLAATLEAIAEHGPEAFYTGEVAEDIVASAKAAGGALTLDDLKAYKPIERKPLSVVWEGYQVYTMPPPSAGGMMLVQALRLFEKAELVKLGRDTGAYQHLLAEGMRGAIADRARYLGDPAFEKYDIQKLMSAQRMQQRRKKVSLHRTHNIPRFGLEEHGTHHLVTSDAAGNMVSLTTTVNRLFGAKLTATKSGVQLNDELDDFTANKDVASFGMKQSPNRARAGARPVSSMTPTIVIENGAPVLGIGGSGGTTIATNVTQLVLARLAFGVAPQKLVSERRFYVPPWKWYIALEKGAPRSLWEDLEARGEIVGTMPFTTSAVQLIAVDKGRKVGAADPRKAGKALGR
ncbi:MAG: gamma-glutamyltransferase [Myxococcales bacterium]|nr:gamma-glutamyltransferase [Myxococcales bacterium]